MSSLQVGPITLAKSWEPILHSSIRNLKFPTLPFNCSDCWRVKIGVYHKDIKCCEYHPEFPNFLIGEILEEGQKEGSKETVLSWVKEKRGDPLWMYIPPNILDSYLYPPQLSRPSCPLLDKSKGQCTVYEHRPYSCIAFNCIFPASFPVVAFWNSLSSLLMFHSTMISMYLMEKLGIDLKEYKSARKSISGKSAWEKNSLREEVLKGRWQKITDYEKFYRDCFRFIMEHKETIREDVIKYHKKWLISKASQWNLSKKRINEIKNIPLEPQACEPPEEVQMSFREKFVMDKRNHCWTIPEHEGYILWYHQQAWKKWQGNHTHTKSNFTEEFF